MHMEEDKCLICGKISTKCSSEHCSDYECSECGKYKSWGEFESDLDDDFRNKLRCYIFYHKNELSEGFVIGDEPPHEDMINKYISKQMVENWYPKTFSGRFEKALMYLVETLDYIGQTREYCINELSKIFFLKDADVKSIVNQLCYYSDFMYREGYSSKQWATFSGVKCKIDFTPKALSRVDELTKNQSNNRDVFVAMSFSSTTDGIREAIRKGIEKAQYSAKIIDEIIHNQQIVPYMIQKIRESKFLIMDITEPNFGAYYEAGYAYGLGKEVIITCRRDVFTEKERKCDKDDKCNYKEWATKPHFDIVQKQILVWDDEEDLTNRLEKWITELMGR